MLFSLKNHDGRFSLVYMYNLDAIKKTTNPKISKLTNPAMSLYEVRSSICV